MPLLLASFTRNVAVVNRKFETLRDFKLLGQVQTLRLSAAINKDKQANNLVFQDFLSLVKI